MRQKQGTDKSFSVLREIFQAIRMQKKGLPTNAKAQRSDTNAKPPFEEPQEKETIKQLSDPKNTALNPTKKAFSERQQTTLKRSPTSEKNALKHKTLKTKPNQKEQP